uniref:Uncharacterized protein n=1 Tax=Steinernema glaseri TaxID=37863 RepID=A0A1I7Z9P5_9BILA
MVFDYSRDYRCPMFSTSPSSSSDCSDRSFEEDIELSRSELLLIAMNKRKALTASRRQNLRLEILHTDWT